MLRTNFQQVWQGKKCDAENDGNYADPFRKLARDEYYYAHDYQYDWIQVYQNLVDCINIHLFLPLEGMYSVYT